MSEYAGADAVELAKVCGLILDPWQAFAVTKMLAENAAGNPAAFEAVLLAPRQNGKNAILEAYELAKLFVLGAEQISHSAHLFSTALGHFKRLKILVDASPALRRRVKRISNSHGEEGIELTDGREIRFNARDSGRGAGRGWSPDTLVYDEALKLPEDVLAATIPSLSARRGVQIVYSSSAGLPDSHVLRELVKRGRSGHDGDLVTAGSLCYLEWCRSKDADPSAPGTWAESNPGLGYRQTVEGIQLERHAMLKYPEKFDRERNGHWADEESTGLFDMNQWAGQGDPGSHAVGDLVYGVAVSPDRDWAGVAVAGRREDGAMHTDGGHHRRGVAWVLDTCIDLDERFGPVTFVIDGGGPAESLIKPMRDAGLDVIVFGLRDVTAAAANYLDDLAAGSLWHNGDSELTEAVQAAKRRPVGDGVTAFGRKASGEDITLLEASSLAVQGVKETEGGVNIW